MLLPKRKVLVTGASGMLGHHIVTLLAQDPQNQIFIPLRRPGNTSFDSAAVTSLRADLADPVQVRDAIRSAQCDVVIHCAASGLRFPKPDWFQMAKLNVDSTLTLFEASGEIPNCHFIHISTGLVYQEQKRPLREADSVASLHPYGASKAGADLLIRAAAAEFNRRLTVVRPFSFTGLRDAEGRLFPSLLRAAAMNEPFPMSAGQQVRDFSAVQDVASAVVACVTCAQRDPLEVVNIGGGDSSTLEQLIRRVCRELELPIDLQLGAKPYHPYEPMHLVADLSRARQLLDWQPSTNLAYAVWELARCSFPNLKVTRPRRER
jgi:nucleoside-diphosphate-sugar epimerase